jgi:hypothetical protein
VHSARWHSRRQTLRFSPNSEMACPCFGVINDGTPPATWTTLTLPSACNTTITNLTPGANYAFQVRAFDRLGYTD